jgi:hypothetical protein
MIRMSENIDDIEDQQEIFKDNEPLIFSILIAWHNLLLDQGVVDQELGALGKVDPSTTVYVEFPAPKRYMTDKEKLEILEKRKDLGLDSIIDSIMRDNPDLNREDAILKFKQVLEDKLKFNSNQLIQPLLELENKSKEGDQDEDEDMDVDEGDEAEITNNKSE